MRASEICYMDNFFEDSIVVFGNKTGNSIAPLNYKLKKNLDHNNATNDKTIIDYQKMHMLKILEKDPSAQFMFYNQIMAIKYFEDCANIICLNKKSLISQLDDKIYTREYYKNKVPSLRHFILKGNEIDLLKLRGEDDEQIFVVQSKNGSGGSGTLVYHDDSQRRLLNGCDNFIVTKYYKDSISINIHLIISRDNILVLPGSIQIIENQYDHLVYKGCDFIGFEKIKESLRIKANKYSKIIGEDLQKRGYLGVCGIDFLICEDEVYFMEINSRFQNSSTVLNKALVLNGLNSLQEMCYNSFFGKQIKYSQIKVNYSAYLLYYGEETKKVPKINPIEILDEPDIELEVEKLSYQKTLVYDKMIFGGESYGIMENKK